MRNVAQSLADEQETAQEIVGRVVGLYQRKRKLNESRNFSRPPLSSLNTSNGIEFQTQAQGSSDSEIPRPHEAPAHEREFMVELEELADGRTRNRAQDAGYQDPLAEENFPGSGSTSSDGTPRGPSLDGNGASGDAANDADNDLADWLWSLIKTMRASMDEAKLYPLGKCTVSVKRSSSLLSALADTLCSFPLFSH